MNGPVKQSNNSQTNTLIYRSTHLPNATIGCDDFCVHSNKSFGFEVEPLSGRVSNTHWVKSPNFDNRPQDEAPSLVVVHAISLPPNQFGGEGVEALFTNRLNPKEHPYYQTISGLRVSAHLFVRRDGSVIQFVALNKRAWHAGISCFEEREKCNDFSIGIELEGSDLTPFTSIQYRALAQLIVAIRRAYPQTSSWHRIVGHSHIAPGRKTDPGPYFLWDALKRLLND
jgi:AmpD protein